jgi:selenocysteine lyase/cysteine desulfurase
MPAPAATVGDPLFAALRRQEFSRLDRTGHAYLDYTGSALYAERQVIAHQTLLRDSVFGNPHAESGTSRASTAVIEQARAALLRFLDADDSDYVVCFTANASAAIKLVAESYPFGPSSECVLSADNHNSVNGIREYAARAGAPVRYIPLDSELRLTDAEAVLAANGSSGPGLVAFPAQSNFSGVRHPLNLVEAAHARGYDVLLDAAAFVPSAPLSLREHAADFVALSFYKIFGYPTGVGALVARRAALARLDRPWIAGGTVEFVSVQGSMHRLRADAAGFEDGTPDFLSIAALAAGFDLVDEIGIGRISAHVASLTELMLDGLTALSHRDGRPLVRVYGPVGMSARGGTVAFNVLDRRSRPVPYAVVEARAREAGVSLRGGCFCNPGASEAAFGFPETRATECLRASATGGFSVERFADCLGPHIAVGAVRASVGLANDARDVERMVEAVGYAN